MHKINLLYYYRTDKRRKFHKPFSLMFERLELKMKTDSLQCDDSGSKVENLSQQMISMKFL